MAVPKRGTEMQTETLKRLMDDRHEAFIAWDAPAVKGVSTVGLYERFLDTNREYVLARDAQQRLKRAA
jgi:hypothetical protein